MFGNREGGRDLHSYDSTIDWYRDQQATRSSVWQTDPDNNQPRLTDGLGNVYWFCTTTGGSITVTLPSAADTVGRLFTVKRLTAGANTLTVTTVSGNIDGAATWSINTQYASYTFTSDGTDYWVI